VKRFIITIPLALLLLCSFSAWGQICSKGASVVFIQTKCPCTGALISVGACQGTFGGAGCQDFRTTNFCGSTCSVGSAGGCLSGGPKSQTVTKRLEDNLDRLFVKQAQIVFVTCNVDNGAFAKWLSTTSASRIQNSEDKFGK